MIGRLTGERLAGLPFLWVANGVGCTGLVNTLRLVAHLGKKVVHPVLQRAGVEDSLEKEPLDRLFARCAVEHIGALIHAELLQDGRQLQLEHVLHPAFDAVSKDEVDRLHRLGLSDAIHAADALLNPHRVPGQVVVDDDTAKLKI